MLLLAPTTYCYPARMATVVHNDNCACCGTDSGFDVFGIDGQPILPFYVAEDRSRADVPDRVGGRHEVEGGNKHLVAWAAADCEQRQV